MTSYIAVLRLDESSTGWALSYGDARNRDYNEVCFPMPLKLLYEPGGEKEIYLGHEAVSVHMDHIENAQTGYYFFTNIFSLLTKTSRENLDENKVHIEDVTGKSLPAVNVFAMIIQSLKDDMKRQLQFRFTFDVKKDLYYVIIVPALLQESREMNLITKAALKAGIEDKMVSIVTDIVALSFFCQFASSHGFSSKDKYLFVRIGDTMDIMKQGCQQNDGSESGSTVSSFQDGMLQVEEAMEKFMIKIFSQDVFEKFKAHEFSDYLDMKNDIAIKIRTVSIHAEMMRLKIPISLLDMYKDITKKEFKDDLCKFQDLAMSQDKMKIPASQFMDPLEKAKIGVLSHIKAELDNETIDSVLVFGEFAQTNVIQEGVKLLHENVKFISGSDILSGAVVVGKRKTPGQIIKLAPEAIMVASLDIGTAYSGWAYSFFADFISDPRKISVQNWNAGSLITAKTPTCLLVRPDGKTIEAFGYEAENRYKELIEDDNHASYYFFRRFKMMLYRKLSEKINRNLTLEDEMGRSLLAIDVFAMSIRFLKDNLLELCNNRLSGEEIVTRDVQWVLTVPAIWNDGAKQFMREAALKAGIESRRLTLALEPESASIYCRHQNISAANSETRGKDISCLKEGKRYMIVDAGGGTVDITIHEVGKNGSIKEERAASGGDWGGTDVDKEFETVLLDLIGTQILRRFKNENMEDYLNFWREFELKKRLIAPSTNRAIRMTIPVSLTDTFKDLTHIDLAKCISETHYAKDIEIKSDKMTISANMMRSFFNNSINSIISHVDSLQEGKHIEAIIMVGGYSESIMLQKAVKINFPTIEIVVPEETSYTVMKGAVIFGFIPTIISKRILKFTYGVRVVVNFLKGKHPESKRLQTDAGDKCQDIFDKHVEKDKEVNVGETPVWRVYTPVNKTQKHLNISVFASEKSNPEYTDKDCHFVGEMIVDLSDSGELDRKFEVALSFSCTEIVVAAKEMITGKETHATIDFLG